MNRISIIALRYNSASPIIGTIDSVWSQDYGNTLYEKYGKFDQQFKLSSDFDLIFEISWRSSVSFEFIPEMVVKMRVGEKNTSSIKRILLKNRKGLESCKNGVRTNIFKFYSKYLTKIINFR